MVGDACIDVDNTSWLDLSDMVELCIDIGSECISNIIGGQSHKWSHEVKFALSVVLTNNFDSDAKTCTRADGIANIAFPNGAVFLCEHHMAQEMTLYGVYLQVQIT